MMAVVYVTVFRFCHVDTGVRCGGSVDTRVNRGLQ